MKLKRTLFSILILLALTSGAIYGQAEGDNGEEASKSGLQFKSDAAFEGYTVFTPLVGQTVYFLDMDGQVVKSWDFDAPTAQEVYLLENGNLLRMSVADSIMLPEYNEVGGVAGRIEEYNHNGDLVWSFDYAGDTYQQHHDIEPLPNGNILVIAWEVIQPEEALAAGMKPELLPENGSLWPDHVAEIDPATNEIVWQWRVWDHLVQDYDPTLPNYGVISEHPERIDINYVGQRHLGDWQHSNSINYNPDLDQIILSVRNFSEIWIIDHSTSTEEAATSSGGRSGMGGDLLYRWGNPEAYQAGTANDQVLFGQHDAQWIKPDYPGAGNILIYNNGDETRNRIYSSVVEIAPPLTASGTYERMDNLYKPSEIVWEYTAMPPESMFAPFVSSAQRLPNGNTLICNCTSGHILEVTPEGEVVWDYINEFAGNLPITGYFGPTSIFRAKRYAPDYLGLLEYEFSAAN